MHLYLPSLNNAAVHFLASLFGVGATRESYKTESLFMPGKRKTQRRMPLTSIDTRDSLASHHQHSLRHRYHSAVTN